MGAVLTKDSKIDFKDEIQKRNTKDETQKAKCKNGISREHSRTTEQTALSGDNSLGINSTQ